MSMNVHSTRSVGAAFAACAICLSFSPRAAGALKLDGPFVSMDLRPDRAGPWTGPCSLHGRFCVRAAPGTPRRFQLAAVAAGDRAWEAMTRALRVPPPEGALGDPWDVYLVDDVQGGAEVISDERDPRARFDRESTFALVDRATPIGCRLDFALARAIAAGSLRRQVPATDLASQRAQSEELARLATPCAPAEDADAVFQAMPWRGLFDSSSDAFDRGASLFLDWIDASFGSEPGAVLLGAWALSPTRTEPHAWQWAATPTTFDVFRTSLKGALGPETTFDDVLLKFAVTRAGILPAPAVAWNVPWPILARRITPAWPVAPTGVSYVRVNREGAPPGSKLRLEAQWEDYARMRWIVLKRDPADRTLSELSVISTERATTASMTVEQLDGVDNILIVAQNLGSTEHAFNPHQDGWEPHGWLLTLEGLGPRGP